MLYIEGNVMKLFRCFIVFLFSTQLCLSKSDVDVADSYTGSYPDSSKEYQLFHKVFSEQGHYKVVFDAISQLIQGGMALAFTQGRTSVEAINFHGVIARGDGKFVLLPYVKLTSDVGVFYVNFHTKYDRKTRKLSDTSISFVSNMPMDYQLFEDMTKILLIMLESDKFKFQEMYYYIESTVDEANKIKGQKWSVFDPKTSKFLRHYAADLFTARDGGVDFIFKEIKE